MRASAAHRLATWPPGHLATWPPVNDTNGGHKAFLRLSEGLTLRCEFISYSRASSPHQAIRPRSRLELADGKRVVWVIWHYAQLIWRCFVSPRSVSFRFIPFNCIIKHAMPCHERERERAQHQCGLAIRKTNTRRKQTRKRATHAVDRLANTLGSFSFICNESGA